MDVPEETLKATQFKDTEILSVPLLILLQKVGDRNVKYLYTRFSNKGVSLML